MARHPNANWKLPQDLSWNHVPIAVLMDIRDELQKLNRLLHCGNCVAIPHKLDKIIVNTMKTKRRRKKAK